MNILLVEDHPFQRDVIAGQLMQLLSGDDTLIFAESGNAALEKILHGKPDLVFCDLELPDMDGIKLLSNAAERGFMGCIVITSAASQKVMDTVKSMCEHMSLNVLGVLPKPASIPLLKYYLTLAMEHDTDYPQDLLPLTDDEVLEAWKANLFETWFQPIVRFDTGEWVACEALQRMKHPIRGTLTPISFLSQLSNLNLESELTFSVINAVIANQTHLDGHPVGINVSVNNLIELNFVDEVIELGHQYPNLNQLIYFELHEPENFSQIAQLQEAASRLLLNGFRIAIDDFGSGYSTLQQVEFLPLDSLKIGLNLVLPMLSSRTAFALVEASNLVANRIGVASVAEGIECIEVWHSLRDMGCDYGQGFFIARPMPADQLKHWQTLWNSLLESRTLCPPIALNTIEI
ncbi:response regulator receiver modulated diguanylate phosphodiesterase [Grimontia indica]|uniref:Response regulator receiver modulated diguanylate phosphodiesterase n=1 Tax=Grimontia indica TaxID=1056512 RepID=R1GPA7_9GAMM|nr:EAL domain-containing response regulator [Grimontia indica]EOD78023.1 response regulator receiver modulated diguanylate phosphodiesterase [Grimontia indica]